MPCMMHDRVQIKDASFMAAGTFHAMTFLIVSVKNVLSIGDLIVCLSTDAQAVQQCCP